MPEEAKKALEKLAEAVKDLPPEKLRELAAFAEGCALAAGQRKDEKA